MLRHISKEAKMYSKNKIIILALIMSTLLLTSCINISVNQKLKRSGKYDLTLTISTSAEYAMILPQLKEGFKVDGSVKDKFTYSETETSLIYSFKNVDPRVNTKLFQEVEQEIDEENPLGQSEQMDSSFINPENVIFEKNFKFPNYEYRYEINLDATSEEKNEKVVLTKEEYIIDDANVISNASEDRIMEVVNKIYQNDSLEIIVITKQDMTMSEFFTYKTQFLADFDFKEDSGKNIVIFVSEGDTKVCQIQNNLFLSDIAKDISEINQYINTNCASDTETQIINVMDQFETLFEEKDVSSGSDEIMNQMTDLFKVGYTIEVFGDIVETNGLEMSGNKVKFDINPLTGGNYYVVFEDFFLIALLGNNYWIYLIILILLLVGMVGFFIVKKKNSAPEQIQAPLAVNPQLVDYVRKAKEGGMNEIQIKNSLIQNGWKEEDVELAFRST